MTDEVRTEVEQIKQQEDVKEALKQTAGPTVSQVRTQTEVCATSIFIPTEDRK
jgi:hypothetical protein